MLFSHILDSYPQVYPHKNLTVDNYIFIGGGMWRIVGNGASISGGFVMSKPQYIDISKFAGLYPI